jgi:hypothetical protein
MKFEFRPIFKGFRFKPEDYRRLMKRIFTILWAILALIVAALIAFGALRFPLHP